MGHWWPPYIHRRQVFPQCLDNGLGYNGSHRSSSTLQRRPTPRIHQNCDLQLRMDAALADVAYRRRLYWPAVQKLAFSRYLCPSPLRPCPRFSRTTRSRVPPSRHPPCGTRLAPPANFRSFVTTSQLAGTPVLGIHTHNRRKTAAARQNRLLPSLVAFASRRFGGPVGLPRSYTWRRIPRRRSKPRRCGHHRQW